MAFEGEAPEEWEIVTLGDLVSLEYGKSLPENSRLPGNVPVYGSSGITGWHNEALVNQRGIVVGRKGTVGAIYVTDGPFYPIDTTYFVKQKRDVDFDWLVATLEHLDLVNLNEATGVPGLNRNYAYLQKINLPPLSEQKKIAEILGAVDDAIAKAKAVIERATSIFERALDDLCHGDQPVDEYFLGEIVDELAAGVSVNSENRTKTNGELGILKTSAVSFGYFEPLEHKAVLKNEEIRVKTPVIADRIVISRMNTPNLVGASAYVDRDYPDIFLPDRLWSLHVKTGSPVTTKWLSYWLRSPLARAAISNIATGTSGSMKNVAKKRLLGLPIKVPAREQHDEQVSALSTTEQVLKLARLQTKQLEKTKAGLMADLLSGRKRVPAIVHNAPHKKKQKIVQPAFKRAVFAAEIVSQLYEDLTFGSVKHEKVVHVGEYHAGVFNDIDRHHSQQLLGPYDPKARRSVEGNFKRQKWFDVVREGQRVKYRPLEKFGGHKKYFEAYFGDKADLIQSVIDVMRPLNTERSEMVATLYAVWNDLLLEDKKPTDEEIVDAALAWSERKKEIERDRWLAALDWMRKKGLVPRGSGERTRVAS